MLPALSRFGTGLLRAAAPPDGRLGWPTVALWAAVLVACVAPLWVTELLPFTDLPQHLAAIRVMHSLDDPTYGLAAWHHVDPSRTQYLLYYYAVSGLTSVTGDLEVANKLALSLYALGLPLTLAAFLRAFRREPAVALLATPLVWNTYLFMGFANYVTGFPFLFWALAVLRRAMDAPTRARMVGLVLLTLALWYSHAQLYLLYGLLAGLVGLFGGRGLHPRHWWRQALHLVPTVALMGVWMSASLILAGADAWKDGHGGRNASDTQVRFDPLIDRLSAFPRQLNDVYHGDGDEKLLLALAALALVLAAVRHVAPDPDDLASGMSRGRAQLRARLPDLLAAVTVVTYVLSPLSYKWIWPISHRWVPVVGLFALLALAPSRGWLSARTRVLLLALPGALLAFGTARLHVDRAQAFEAEAGDVRALLRDAEPRRALMSLIFDRGSAVLNQAAYLHFGQYYQVDRGGVATFSFANFPQSPVLYHPETGPPALPNRWEWTPEKFRFATHGVWYDYFLVRDGGRERPRDVFRRHLGRDVALVERRGKWALYRNLQKPWLDLSEPESTEGADAL